MFASWYTVSTMKENTFTPPKSEQRGLATLDFAKSQQGKETGDKKETEAKHEMLVAAVLANALPRILDKEGVANEKTMRIADHAVHGDSVYSGRGKSDMLTLTSINMGHQTSEANLRAGMKLAMIQAFIREVVTEIGGAKIPNNNAEKIANDNIWDKRIFVLPLDRVFEEWNVDVAEREGIINVYPGTQDKQAFDSFFTPEEERDLVLLTYVMQEKFPVSEVKEKRTYGNLQDQAKRILLHDAVNDVVYGRRGRMTEEQADIAYAQAVARKREIGMMVDELYNQLSEQTAPEQKGKEKNESQTKIAELERKNAELAVQLQAANARILELVEIGKKAVETKSKLVVVKDLLQQGTVFNGNKQRALEILSEILKKK